MESLANSWTFPLYLHVPSIHIPRLQPPRAAPACRGITGTECWGHIPVPAVPEPLRTLTALSNFNFWTFYLASRLLELKHCDLAVLIMHGVIQVLHNPSALSNNATGPKHGPLCCCKTARILERHFSYICTTIKIMKITVIAEFLEGKQVKQDLLR